LKWERPELRRRIAARLKERLAQGMVEEVRRLHGERGLPWERLDSYGLEYRYLARHLRGELSEGELVRQLAAAIGDFAKRQETFFRRMERQGVAIHWLDAAGEPLEEMLRVVRPGLG
jgi:tRNA dimethylallyltransferase